MTKALVIGGGIAGPVAAAALKRAGIEAVVYEAHAAPADDLGAFLTLAPNGLAALKSVGMLDTVRQAAAFPSTRFEFVNGAGRILGTLSDGSQQGPPELRTITINRGALQRVLAEAAQEQGLRIEYNKRFTNYTETASGVMAEFADGTTAKGDVLLGADGIHSPVRHIMDQQAPQPAYTGLLGIGGYTQPLDIAPTPEETTRMVFGKRGFFGYQTAASGEVFWFANLGHSELSPTKLAASNPEDWKAHALDVFRDDLPDMGTIMRSAEPSRFLPTGTYDLATLPRWRRGRVALLGDAAHAVVPSSGQGASLAVEDALVLAACLRDVDGAEEAFTAYEYRRRERVERVAAEGRKRGNQKTGSSHPAALLMRDVTMRIVFAMIARFGSHAWIHDYRVNFDQRVEPATPHQAR